MSYNSYFSHQKKVVISLISYDKLVRQKIFLNVRLVSFPDLNYSPLGLVLGMRLVYYHIRSHGLGPDVL